MTNGIPLPKKNDTFKADLNAFWSRYSSINKSFEKISSSLASERKHQRNLNGYNAEKSARNILRNIDGFTSKSQYPMICTPDEAIITMSETLVIDEFITSEYCNKTLFAEVKFQNRNGSIYKKNFKNVYDFTSIQKHQIFIVSGIKYNVGFIQKFNNSFLKTGAIKYVYMLHENDLEEFLNLWKAQDYTDFKSLHFSMNKYV